MRVLVTGGAGYVGTGLVSKLKDFAEVTVLDNMMSGVDGLIPLAKDITIIKGDVRDKGTVARAVDGQDVVVHMAAIVGYPACDLDKQFANDVNVNGTKVVVDSLEQNQLLVYCSTTSSYGKQVGLVTEETELNPLTTYGATKAAGEYVARQHQNHIVFRPASAFGVTGKIRLDLLFNNYSYLAATNGVVSVYQPGALRPIVHVSDFALALFNAAMGQVACGVYNLGSNELVLTKLDMAKAICDISGAELTLMEGKDLDGRDYDIDFTRALKQGIYCNGTMQNGYREISGVAPLIDNEDRYTAPHYVDKYLRGEHNGRL